MMVPALVNQTAEVRVWFRGTYSIPRVSRQGTLADAIRTPPQLCLSHDGAVITVVRVLQTSCINTKNANYSEGMRFSCGKGTRLTEAYHHAQRARSPRTQTIPSIRTSSGLRQTSTSPDAGEG